MTRRPVRRSLAASAATLALLSLAACGGDDSSAEDTGSTGSSTSSTSSSASAGESASTDASDSGASSDDAPAAGSEVSAEEFGATLQTALDKATTANVTTTASAAGLNATGQVDYTSDPPSLTMSADLGQMGSIDVVLVDDVMYLKGEAFGDKYVKIDLDDPDNPLSALGDQLDPAAAFDKLVTGIDTATYVGQEDVDGEQLDHYTTAVQSKVLLQGLPGDVSSASGLPETITYDWWFDGDGLIRKFSADLGPTAGTTEGTFDDWGTDVDITAPPASEVTDSPAFPQPKA